MAPRCWVWGPVMSKEYRGADLAIDLRLVLTIVFGRSRSLAGPVREESKRIHVRRVIVSA